MAPELDRTTRGRTSRSRLRALDAYLLHSERRLLQRPELRDAAFVDFGFGEQPWTTLESAAALRQEHPELPVIGIDQEPHRVEGAQAHADAQTLFRLGGFDSLTQLERPASLVRAMNVLRGYPPAEVPGLHARLAAPLVVGGLLLEGTSDESGAILTAHLLRKTEAGLAREGLLFATDFTRGFAPILFRDWLPRDLRRSVRPGSAIEAFFTRWTSAWTSVREGGSTALPEVFARSAERLLQEGEPLRRDEWLAANAMIVWAPEGGVPRP